jgi:hypothetical protein
LRWGRSRRFLDVDRSRRWRSRFSDVDWSWRRRRCRVANVDGLRLGWRWSRRWMTNCTGWRAAASASGAGGRGSANAGRVDPLGLEMLVVLFRLSGGLVVAVRLGFCSLSASVDMFC